MDSSILKKAGKYVSERKKRRRYKEWISVLTVAVVFGVIFVLAMPASTLEKTAYCGIDEHAHADECYEQTLICGYEETSAASAPDQEPSSEASVPADAHQHEESCYTETKTQICEQEETEGHRHDDNCYTVTESKDLTCVLEESEEHQHDDSCYTVSELSELSCGQEEGAGAHLHTEGCYEISKDLTCGLEESSGSEDEPPLDTAPAETPGADAAHVHTEECYGLKEVCGKEEHTHTQECYDDTFSCGMREHAHENACYGGDGQMICSLPEHAHIQRCRMPVFCGTEHEHEYGCYIGPEVSEEDRARILRTDEMIDALPSYEEIEAELAEFDAADDLDGYEAYFIEISFQAGMAYAHYEDLKSEEEDLQKYVVNSEDLMLLSSLWEAKALDAADADTAMVHSINELGSVNTVALVYGNSGTVLSVTSASFTYWTAVVAEVEGRNFVIREIIPKGQSKASVELKGDKLILFFYDEKVQKPEAACKGAYVQVDFDYKSIAKGCDPNGYGTVTFLRDKPAVNNQVPTVSAASTKDIIEINLYDYGTNINDKYHADADKTQYPAFQQSAGSGQDINLNSKWGGSYNFGDNVTADYIDRNQINFAVSGGNNINGMVRDEHGDNANRAMFGADSPMNKRLVNGYPALANGNSLDYLFRDNEYAVKKNGEGLDGLFQHNPETGEYYFDSRINHAELDGNRFVLYNALLSPNFLMYPFGNFMPFNKIKTETTKASDIDRAYFQNMEVYAASRIEGATPAMQEAYSMLETSLGKFVPAVDAQLNNQNWTGSDVQRMYFNSVKDTNAGRNQSGEWMAESLGKIYNIDYDVPKNFFFGMTMEMDYVQPKGGMTGKGNQYPMVFDFAGDDDVWVYIDDVLMLELSGIHRHVAGTINFVNGTVTYYDYESYAGAGLGATTGRDTGKEGISYSFEKILSDAGMTPEEIRNVLKVENGSYTTFKDYGAHNFKFYYMERGAGSGVCKINFNFPVIPKNSLAVGKEMNLGAGSGALGNPSFDFQVLKEGANGADLKNDLFIEPDAVYEIYENGVKTGETKTVDDNGIIRLKAGEMAVFADIDSGKGKYFVRELLDERIFEQYGASITVDGTVGTGNELTDTAIDGQPFKGVDSPVKNIDDGSVTLFHFVNNVEIDKTGSLSVTKKLAAGKDDWQSVFHFEITLDGTPLPVGTKYTAGSEERKVETEGVITLAPEETAVIGNILAGSQYTVKETSVSAEGYDVSYSAQPEENGEVITQGGQTYIQGIISHKGETQTMVTVVNANDDYGSLVIEKRIADHKEEYIEGDTFSWHVYLENLASGKLEPYSGPYYLKDAEGYYHTAAGKTEVNDVHKAEPYGMASNGLIPDVSPELRIVIANIPAGSGFYVEEAKESLSSDKYGEPLKELVEGTYDAADAITDADQTVSADGAVKKDTAVQIVITNRLLSWQIVKRSASSADLLLKGAEFELTREGETEASYLGISGEDGVIQWKNAAGEEVGIYDIEEGVYRMKEVKAPVGYVISELYWKLTFSGKGTVPTIVCVREDEPEAEEGITPEKTSDPAGGSQMTFYFDNAVIYQLPNAGGAGIYWYLISGTLFMAASALVLYKIRRERTV